MRRYNQGWRNDSERHSLAARGVKSKGDISWWKMLFTNDYYKKSMEDMNKDTEAGMRQALAEERKAKRVHHVLTAKGEADYDKDIKTEMEQKLRELLGEQMVDDVKSQIQKIETSVPTTRNHYGNYMSALSRFKGENRTGMAQMFIVLGANKQGVIDALKVMGSG